MHLDRIMLVLEAVAVAGRPVSTAELQGATGLPRPTCYRLLRSLARHRLLDDPEETSRYQIGERLVRLALLGRADGDVRVAAAPTMREAASGFGEAVFLARFRDPGVEIIHVETPADPARAHIHPGLGFRPMHACSCSKAIAAFAEEDFRQAIFAGPLKAYTARTLVGRDDLLAEFAEIRARGWAECVEEIEIGVSSVAAPIRIGNIGATFSLGATGPIRRFTARRRREVGEELLRLSAKLGAAIRLHDAAPGG